MRVCLMIEGQEGVTWDGWRALAATAEEAGFEALFRSDHYAALGGHPDRGSLDAWSTINALATLTTRLTLGTLVSPATFRHPSVLAREVVTADHVSNGRVELGLGAGWHEGEHRAHGFPFEASESASIGSPSSSRSCGVRGTPSRSTSTAATTGSSGPTRSPSRSGGPR